MVSPKALENVIRKATKKRPRDRYLNVDDLKRDLNHLKQKSKTIKATRINLGALVRFCGRGLNVFSGW